MSGANGNGDKVAAPSGSPWSAFHSSLAVAVRVPGTPVRQTTETATPKSDPPPSLSTVEEFSGYFNELDLLLEYKLLCLNHPTGVYVLPSSKSLHEWHGVIFIHAGPYKDGIFKFTIYIPDGFPRMRPMLRFQSRIYHPYVHISNGVLNMSRVFPSWDPEKHHLWHVVQYTKQCFYTKEMWEDCDEATLLARAQESVIDSVKNVFDHDSDEGNLMIRFMEVDEKSFRRARRTLLKGDLPAPPATSPQSIFSNVTEQFKHLWERVVNR